MLGLIIHSLKSKKNWFLLNITICIVVAIVLPVLFKSAYEFFAVSSLFIASVIILISTFSDLVFLHDDRKISYYLSKPIGLTKKLNISLVSNIIFCTVTFVVTFIIAICAGSVLSELSYTRFFDNYLSYVYVMYAWLMVLIFVITLSSELTGSTIISALVSVFNFALPLIFYFVIYYIFYILDFVILGIDAGIMSQIFLEKILPLEEIYFLDYVNGNIDVFYFVRLIAFCMVIYIITLLLAKIRKNEKTGEAIVHSGFKYFMSLFASLIAPMLVTLVMVDSNLYTLVIVLVILSTLSYYILISAFNKTFRISVQALKIYIPFIIVIIITIFSTAFILNEKGAYIPDESDVKAVCIGNGTSYLKDAQMLQRTSYNWGSLIEADYDEVKDNDSLIILHEKENIKRVIELQQMLLSDEEPKDSYSEIFIIYYLNNGDKVVRTYLLPADYKDVLSQRDISIIKKIMEIARTEEFINVRYKVLVDEYYLNNVKLDEVSVYLKGEMKTLEDFDYKTFAKYFIEDYKELINNEANANRVSLQAIYYIRNYNYIKENYYKETVDEKVQEYNKNNISDLNLIHSVDDGISLDYIILNSNYVKTKLYIESLIKE